MNELDIRTIKRIKDIEAHSQSPISRKELAAACHMNETSAGQYLRELVDSGRMHIASWRLDGVRHRVPLYVWGEGRNKMKPKRNSAVLNERNRVKRMKQDGEAYDRKLSADRARYAAKKAVKAPNTWMSALM